MDDLLSKVNSPQDLKNLSIESLYKLAQQIRDEIIINLSQTGGHLASSLGVVELTIALHSILDSPKDKIIWDVGHQAYAHKILTGRRADFKSLRKLNGISGFPKRIESVHDQVDVGHSSTSISSALGIACARDIKGDDDTIVAVIGDGALTAGMAFEALNHAGHLQKDMIVILNDNEMSISENVGAVSNYLDKLRTNPKIHRAKKDLGHLINAIPAIGDHLLKTANRVKNSLKYLLVSGILFEEFGFTYLGPIDGHNIKVLQEHIKDAQKIGGPVLIHTITTKGKGYTPAEEEPAKFHGVGPFNIRTGEGKNKKQRRTYTNIFSQTLIDLAKDDSEIVAITAAMPSGTGLNKFAQEFPKRFYDVGIAEQHAITLGAGLALNGVKPFVTLYSTFLQRGYDQVMHDVCIQNLPVKLAIDRAGIVGRDGETHQGVFDYAFLRHLPNMTVMAPKDENELKAMIKLAANYNRPIALRYPRGEVVGVERVEIDDLEIGKAEVLCEGKDGAILAIGSMVYPALEVVNDLAKEGIDLTVVNSRFVKPLDQELILGLADKYNRIFTIEEHVLQGGFGSAVAELLLDNDSSVRLTRIGLPDKFIEHGSSEELLARYGLDIEGIKKRIKEVMQEG
ncbi:1-deoxy-D-xylulose-5-phosphate synthase [Orenia metallireducens]|jgi:1-deoxy-D-xylulose-5-phosphate synthase|uniref:1-deoxy-D-xylulose-5-phosphate synthase n=1 Tax=Orenia metallireducens TaxID=1413210 RepID=A0A285HLW1_9FIRM|nr:1-deoxy-D-xylulose-5-phosphate synthase [Orenia metallireducens]PRX26934.1 1-deoxy-D-xylulose-5-phosphate synthase [Orenia metallireducens]SNY36729.1 1-deoxy-D-xylulose-5-phosphate synthase [Orenia metallireducens]